MSNIPHCCETCGEEIPPGQEIWLVGGMCVCLACEQEMLATEREREADGVRGYDPMDDFQDH